MNERFWMLGSPALAAIPLKMDPVLVRFLEKFPTAAATAAATVDEVARVAGPLGLQERRPVAIIRFSRERKFSEHEVAFV